ncbi:NAD(P)/FAD-dependent oxidoreductase [Planomicrobium sp. CPCC 101079]|uniref:NAD(P)/FAD-dependent oxidoreductase n=1 Tax=Planomicrobium sp. CPCC 101079 TaxID=2599618 RepID=UPI0011B35A60|nr:NAD(P)/FAD-dependent oxidoreductase [Planomicrobium sp. CPCC 101079]TWT09237.1 NAD(P)/FAD-dependent oxidoreductase [Planomicrobium sp. CPCC 101079]
MILDCAVIGGGPAGLNASLVLGRSRRKTVLFDDNMPRNAVTSESHGFMTRDGIDPQEMKRIAQEELRKYPNVAIEKQRVKNIDKAGGLFRIETEDGSFFSAKNVILATGFKEVLPEVKDVEQYYGTSLFSCPFCDGWELKDRPLAVISENPKAFHMAKVVFNWTEDLAVCTNGKQILSEAEKTLLETKGIKIYEQEIHALIGKNGQLEKIEFKDGSAILREGGFITPEWVQASTFGSLLGCKLNVQGGIESDSMGRTTIDGVYAAGDTLITGASQLIIAAAEGSRAAIGVNAALIEEKFKSPASALK